MLTIKAQWVNIILINVYAPTDEKTQEEKDNFYGKLENIVDTIPNNKILVILRDLKTKIGK